MMRKPIVRLDKYEAYLYNNVIEVPVDNVYDPFVHDLIRMINDSDGLIYFEERYFSVVDYKIARNSIKLNIEEHTHVRREKNKV